MGDNHCDTNWLCILGILVRPITVLVYKFYNMGLFRNDKENLSFKGKIFWMGS